MARPEIQSWKEADEYLNAGRNKTERPLYSAWRIKRSDTNDDIIIRHKDNDPDFDVIVYHKDESVTIRMEYGNKVHELIEQYNGQGLTFWGSMFYLESFGTEPDDYQPCNGCNGTGQNDHNCNGPGMCHQIDFLPSYLVETGAPGAHCEHFETSKHRLGTCEHGNTSSHPTKINCYWCQGATVRNMGGQKINVTWPTDSPTYPYKWEPLTIKDGKVISTHPAHNEINKKINQLASTQGGTINEESDSNVMAGSV